MTYIHKTYIHGKRDIYMERNSSSFFMFLFPFPFVPVFRSLFPFLFSYIHEKIPQYMKRDLNKKRKRNLSAPQYPIRKICS